ncbi:MAG: hypothetical protein U1E53_23880 [Dongiaceae bacterium]
MRASPPFSRWRQDRLPAAASALLLLTLAACTAPPEQATDPSPGFGHSFNQNAAVMIIDPQPVGARNTTLPLDGHRAQGAIIRYYTDNVIQPQSLSTSSVGGVPGAATAGNSAGTSTTTGAMQ